jgi:hypothetical protein
MPRKFRRSTTMPNVTDLADLHADVNQRAAALFALIDD